MNITNKMEKLEINIDTVGYSQKPNSNSGYINNRVVKNIEEISISEFADQVGNQGKTFIRALVKGARTIENLHNLIKNNGQDFNLTNEQLELAERLK